MNNIKQFSYPLYQNFWKPIEGNLLSIRGFIKFVADIAIVTFALIALIMAYVYFSGTRSNRQKQYIKKFKNKISNNSILKKINHASSFIQKVNSSDEEIKNCFSKIDDILNEDIFNGKLNKKKTFSLNEKIKFNCTTLEPLFNLVETNFSLLEKIDRKLALRLKIKLANLPVTFKRKNFPLLFLSESEQLQILIDDLQAKENAKTNELIQTLPSFQLNHFPQKEINKIAKMTATATSLLNRSNQTKLQNALKQSMGLMGNDQKQRGIDWTRVSEVKNLMLVKGQRTSFNQNKLIEKLWRISKARLFFESQLGRDPNEFHIPRWYHATKYNMDETEYGLITNSKYSNCKINYFDPIISEGKIQVMTRLYRGAWVSNQRERLYGNAVFAFNRSIEKIDRGPSIHTKHPEGIRWRGLQKDIPFIHTPSDPSDQGKEYLSLVGVDMNKSEKLKAIDDLKTNGLKNPYVCSVKQADYIQKKVLKALGSPNLSMGWW